jgi:Family of unknown function (DUF6071)
MRNSSPVATASRSINEVDVIKLLVANGCSYTRGVELADPATQSWPCILSQLLGIEFVNLGCGGGSNRRIVRTTVALLDDICRDKSVAPDEVLVLCLWTDTARHEYYEPHTKEHPLSKNRPELPDELHWHRLTPQFAAAGRRSSIAFYENLWSEDGSMTNFFLDWVMLDGFLRGAGYTARYGYAWEDVIASKISKPARRFARLLNAETVYGGLPPRKGCTFREVADDYPFGPGHHPLQEGHACFAKTLANWLVSDPQLSINAGVNGHRNTHTQPQDVCTGGPRFSRCWHLPGT